MKYTLEAGRCICRDGKPFVTIHGVGDYQPVDADKFARDVVAAMNGTRIWVRIYDVDQDKAEETLRGDDWLHDIFEPDDPELERVRDELNEHGTAKVGGGAAPLVELNCFRPQRHVD